MKYCIKFLITSTSIIAKTIVKIVERLKSYLHFQLKLRFPCNFLTCVDCKKITNIQFDAFLITYITSLTFVIFSILIIRGSHRRLRFIDATQDVHKSTVFNYFVNYFSFFLILLPESTVYFIIKYI